MRPPLKNSSKSPRIVRSNWTQAVLFSRTSVRVLISGTGPHVSEMTKTSSSVRVYRTACVTFHKRKLSSSRARALRSAFSMRSRSLVGVSGILSSQPCRTDARLSPSNNRTSGNILPASDRMVASPPADVILPRRFDRIRLASEIRSIAQLRSLYVVGILLPAADGYHARRRMITSAPAS